MLPQVKPDPAATLIKHESSPCDDDRACSSVTSISDSKDSLTGDVKVQSVRLQAGRVAATLDVKVMSSVAAALQGLKQHGRQLQAPQSGCQQQLPAAVQATGVDAPPAQPRKHQQQMNKQKPQQQKQEHPASEECSAGQLEVRPEDSTSVQAPGSIPALLTERLRRLKPEPSLANCSSSASNGSARQKQGALAAGPPQSAAQCKAHNQQQSDSSRSESRSEVTAATEGSAVGGYSSASSASAAVPGPAAMHLLQQAVDCGLYLPNQRQMDFFRLADQPFNSEELLRLYGLQLAPMHVLSNAEGSQSRGAYSRVQKNYKGQPGFASAMVALGAAVPQLQVAWAYSQCSRKERQEVGSSAAAVTASAAAKLLLLALRALQLSEGRQGVSETELPQLLQLLLFGGLQPGVQLEGVVEVIHMSDDNGNDLLGDDDLLLVKEVPPKKQQQGRQCCQHH